MANTVIGASVQVDFKSVGNMRKALKEANQELIRMQAQFGDASKEALAAAEKVGTLKGQIKDAAETANLFDPSKKFQAFVDLGANIASGFSAVQGAMALVGVESEDLQRTMVKLQGAMALAQGLGQLKEFGESWGRLVGVVKKATAGVSTFGKALMATGIGLAIAAIGTLVAYWDDLKDAILGTTEMTKAYKEAQNEATKAASDANVKLSEVTIAFKLAKEGKMEASEALEIYNEKLGDTFGKTESLIEAENLVTANTDAYIKSIRARSMAQVFYAKASEAAVKAQSGEELGPTLLQSLEDYIVAGPLGFLNETVETISDNQKKALDDQAKFSAEGDKFIKEALEAESSFQKSSASLQEKGNDKKTAQEKEYQNKKLAQEQEHQRKLAELRQRALDLQMQLLGDSLKINLNAQGQELFDLNAKFIEQRKILEQGGQDTVLLTALYEKQKQAIIDKYANEEKKNREDVQNELNKINEEIRLFGIKDLREKEKAELAISYADQLKEIEKNENYNAEQKAQFRAALLTKQKLEEDALNEKFRQEDLQKRSAELLSDSSVETTAFADRLKLIKDRKALENQIIFASEEERKKFIKENEEATTKVISDQFNARVQLARAVGDALGALSDIVGKETATGKALAIAQATINTFLGITEVWKSKAVLPEPFNTATKIAATVTTAAGGFAAVRNIAKTKVPGGGGGGGGLTPPPSPAPLAPVLSPAVQGQTINADAINNLGNTAFRAYVMNSDIQNNDQRNAYLQRNARIG